MTSKLCYHHTMTKAEAIAIITAKLAKMDDARVQTVANIVQSMQDDTKPLRQLSARERALLDQSKADFSAGRAYSLEESIAFADEQLARRGVPKSSA